VSDKLILPSADVMYANAMARPAEIKREVARKINERACGVKRIAAALDLAVLKPTAGRRDVEVAAALVNQHGICSLCVPSSFVPLASNLTARVCSVVGFPHGNSCITAKVDEAGEALYYGAVELDIVVSYGRFMEGNPDPVVSELTQIVNIAHARRAIVKAILETCCLSLPQIADLCRLCADCGVDYVKTSTGFSTGGADTMGVRCMLDTVGSRCLVNASGGIDCYEKAKMFLDMGCARIGASKYLELLPSWG
jgi:deoxyribose-phosphate aldolase